MSPNLLARRYCTCKFLRSKASALPGRSRNQPDRATTATARAHHLFDEMPDQSVESVTTSIGRLANDGKHREAVLLFSNMLTRGISPNEYTLSTVTHSSLALSDLNLGRQIHAHAVKINLSSNVFVGSAVLDLYDKISQFSDALRIFEDIESPNVVSYTTLIRGYMKEGRVEEATELFQSMPERNVVSWNCMISGCSQRGDNEEALRFFLEMLRQPVIPSQSSYPCVIISAASMGALGLGRSLHCSAIKFLGELGLFLCNSLISFYAKCGSMEDSLLLFTKMQDRNIVSWNACLCGYAQNGQASEAIKLHETMKKQSVEPNSVTLLGLLSAASHGGLVDDGYKLFNEARRKNPSILNKEHYACMVDLLSRSGRFKEAERFLHGLPFDPGVGLWKALLGGCRVHWNTETGEVAARKMMELNPRDASSYLMLSNAQSAAARWEKVVEIRGKMKEKGVGRVPGSSWIEIRGNVEVFLTGDRRQSRSFEIYSVLGFLVAHDRSSEDMIDIEACALPES